jgi:hypothetical protein
MPWSGGWDVGPCEVMWLPADQTHTNISQGYCHVWFVKIIINTLLVVVKSIFHFALVKAEIKAKVYQYTRSFNSKY